MATIYHVIDVKCSPKQLFEALTKAELLSNWWLPEVKADPRLGGLNEFRAGENVYNRMRIDGFEPPNKVSWICENESSADPWRGTRLLFEIEQISDGVVNLHFRHQGWPERTSFFGQCSYHWGRHLEMLKALCESGRSDLTSNEVFIADQAFKQFKNKDFDVIHLSQKLASFSDHWSPKIIAELNGQLVKLAKFKGEFVWHSHESEDELFLVLKGDLVIEMRNGSVHLGEGEMFVVPRGVEHKPVARKEVSAMMFEPASTLNTGQVENELTKRKLDRI